MSSLTYNNLKNNNIFKPKRYKDFTNKSLFNAILSIKDKRNTNKFIKELNKNKNYNSNKIIPFSFIKDNKEEMDDEFYFPLKYKDINNNLFDEKENKRKNFYQNNFNKNKINNIIKKNSSFDNFGRFSEKNILKMMI